MPAQMYDRWLDALAAAANEIMEPGCSEVKREGGAMLAANLSKAWWAERMDY